MILTLFVCAIALALTSISGRSMSFGLLVESVPPVR